MGSNYTSKKIFSSFKGLNLRDSDLIRSEQYASEVVNAEYRETGAISKRKGYQAKSRSRGGAGLAVYEEVNQTNGQIEPKLVCIDDTLSVLQKENLTLTYTGTELAYVSMSLDPDTLTFKFKLFENSDEVFSFDLGKGRDELVTIDLDDLIPAVNALADFSITASGLDSTPAAFIKIMRQESLQNPLEIEYEYFQEAASTVVDPFSAHFALKDNKEFENASTTNLNGILYIANGISELHKYDGTNLYRAGLPTPDDISGNIVAGTLTGTYKYRITIEHTDAKGNFVESVPSNELEVTLSSQGYELTYTNLQPPSGFDVDSTEMKINFWRTNNAGTIFFLIGQTTNDSSNVVVTFTDTGLPIGAQYIEPLQPAGLPPRGKYITKYRGRLIITGKVDDVNNTFYSTIDSPEYFPPADNAFLTDDTRNTGVKALGNILYIFQEYAVHALTGDLESGRFRVDLLTRGDIGCVAHATIQEVNNKLYFLANNGVYAVAGVDQEPVQISEIIEPVFGLRNRSYCEQKAVAANWLLEDKYILVLPTVDSDAFTTTSSTVVVHDYYRDAWLIWDKIDGSGGMAVLQGDLYFTERRNDGSLPAVANYLYKILNTGDTWDYADHDEEIEFLYSTHWESMGEPSVFKKYLRLKVHSLDTSVSDFETDGFILKIDIESDYIKSNPTSSFELDFGQENGVGYGNLPWGAFTWGNSKFSALKGKIRQTKARSQRILFSNNLLHQNVLISGYEVEIATPYKLAIKE